MKNDLENLRSSYSSGSKVGSDYSQRVKKALRFVKLRDLANSVTICSIY